MASRYVLVVDAGTSGGRCLVFDGDAKVVGRDARPWSYLSGEPSALARAFDPQALWQHICQLIAGSLRDARILPAQVAAITVTSQRQGVVFLDDGGREIYAGPNLDLRAVFEGAAIDAQMRDRVYQTTGHLPSFLFAPAKLRWFQLHHPDAYARIAFVLPLGDWLAWRLTGTLASEVTLAGEAGLLDIYQRKWCLNLLKDLDLVSNSVPLVEAGTVAGTISTGAARDVGLGAGIPVAVSGADTQCGLLGMAVAQECQVGIVAGWSIPLQMVTGQPLLSPEARTWTGCFPGGSRWVVESSAGDAGNAYRWLADTLWGGGAGAFQQMDLQADAVPAGSQGTVAFLGPAPMNMADLGLKLGGILFPVPLTFSNLGRGHLARASLEAIAYAIRANLEQAEKVSGTRATSIAVGGGMTRTRTFVRVLADVLSREIMVCHTPEASALGAYLCAGVALGDYSSLEEAALSMRPRLRALEPDPVDASEYQDYYAQWVQRSGELRGLALG